MSDKQISINESRVLITIGILHQCAEMLEEIATDKGYNPLYLSVFLNQASYAKECADKLQDEIRVVGVTG